MTVTGLRATAARASFPFDEAHSQLTAEAAPPRRCGAGICLVGERTNTTGSIHEADPGSRSATLLTTVIRSRLQAADLPPTRSASCCHSHHLRREESRGTWHASRLVC
jgi:hypothetical protein